jgi:hypothetical protein
VAAICGVAFFGMVGAAYAAVPLYKLFCQATGFDGTVRKAVAKPTKVLDRKVEIRFDANVRNLPWDFQAMQVSQDIRIGDTGLAFFKVTNKRQAADRPGALQRRARAGRPLFPEAGMLLLLQPDDRARPDGRVPGRLLRRSPAS